MTASAGLRAVELRGPGALVDAAGLVLGTPGLDLVVIRDLVPPRVLRRLESRGSDRHRTLMAALPEWDALTRVVVDWWAEHGYRDFRAVLPLLAPGNVRIGRLAAHLDPAEEDGSLYGPLTMSLVTSRTAGRFFAERPDVDLFLSDGRFDRSAFDALQSAPDHPGLVQRRLRTGVKQGRGDAVLIANHPTPTYHAVDAPDERRAQIFECLLTPAGR